MPRRTIRALDSVRDVRIHLVLADEEEHIDWLEAQFTLIEKMGIENLLRHYIPEVVEVRPVAV